MQEIFCTKKYFGNLIVHVERYHGREKPKRSRNCRSDLENHDPGIKKRFTRSSSRVHRERESYRCDDCNQVFSDKDRLRGHVRVHMDGEMFKC